MVLSGWLELLIFPAIILCLGIKANLHFLLIKSEDGNEFTFLGLISSVLTGEFSKKEEPELVSGLEQSGISQYYRVFIPWFLRIKSKDTSLVILMKLGINTLSCSPLLLLLIG